MSVREETLRLRREIKRLARKGSRDRLFQRYPLVLKPKGTLSLYRRTRIKIGHILRKLGLRRPWYSEPWLPSLKHFKHDEDAPTVVIWALGAGRETVRMACGRFQALHAEMPCFIPVLVTDVADFAFFSRLGWLVEYVPSLSAPASRYAERKTWYLAWRYRDAVAFPLSAVLEDERWTAEELARLAPETRS